MKTNLWIVAVALLVELVAAPAWADGPSAVDIKRCVPVDAHLALYARHNPARDYQREYFAEAWRTFQDERIGERVLQIVIDRMPEEKLAAARSTLEELKTALEPISVEGLLNADELVWAQVMEGPVNHTLLAVRLNSKDASDCERGVRQGFELLARWSQGKVALETSQLNEATVTALTLPKEVPYQPAVARLNDIVLIGSNVGLLRRSLEQLQDASAKSKFDDPRLTEALTHLPTVTDSLVFFDGRQLFQKLRGIGEFIRTQSKGDKSAARYTRLMDRVIDEVAILDYEVTVESTEPGRNRTVKLGKLADGADRKLLVRVLSPGKPLDRWQSWVPADATAYSMSSGINLHAAYDGVISLIREELPESQAELDKLAALQEKIGVNLDRDILQSFSGESVSVTLPVKVADGSTRQDSFTALRCQNPDKIRELVARAVGWLNQIPVMQMQQLRLEDCTDLPGFQKLHAAILQVFGAEPVIGFRDGWMMFASSQEAAKKVLAVRAGEAESIDAMAIFGRLGMDPTGVHSVNYTDIAAHVGQVADVMDKTGAVVPIFLSMAAAKAKSEDLKTLQEIVSLLPSVAKVVRKFDFFEHNLSVIRDGPSPGTYLRESVTEVRMPKEAGLPPAERAVFARLAEIQHAAESLDPDKVFSFVLENDAGALVQNGKLFLTRKDALGATKQGFQGLQKVGYRLDQQHIVLLSPTVALAVAEGSSFAKLDDGTTVSRPFVQSVILILTDGEWKVMHSHRSSPQSR